MSPLLLVALNASDGHVTRISPYPVIYESAELIQGQQQQSNIYEREREKKTNVAFIICNVHFVRELLTFVKGNQVSWSELKFNALIGFWQNCIRQKRRKKKTNKELKLFLKHVWTYTQREIVQNTCAHLSVRQLISIIISLLQTIIIFMLMLRFFFFDFYYELTCSNECDWMSGGPRICRFAITVKCRKIHFHANELMDVIYEVVKREREKKLS